MPHSAVEWAGTRTFERYAGDLRDFAATGYGRRRFRLVGVRAGGTVASSCKLYARELRCGERTRRATGIGAVFTPEALRGRGLATTMLAAVLDAERAAGTDFAFLFSDIRPHFYEELGFKKLPSRVFTLRAKSLDFERIAPVPVEDGDWPAIARCFAALERTRPIALARPPLVWEWMRSIHRIHALKGDAVSLAIRGRRGIVAYCLGRRVVKADAFVVDEFAYAGEAHRHLAGPLLRAAAGDLAKITGWLPPSPARSAIPRGTVRARRDAILMIAPLSPSAREAWRLESPALLESGSDTVWSNDHV